jgi:hypothetical protein
MSRLRTYLKKYRDLDRRSKLQFAWDLFMVWVALVNLHLILFDLTYLWLRPTYYRFIPVVTRIYDPVKGIEPHPLTQAYLDEIDATRALVLEDPWSPKVSQHVEELRTLSFRILTENPFERSGQTHIFDRLKQAVAETTGMDSHQLERRENVEVAVERLWPDDPNAVRVRLEEDHPKVHRALDVNYYREFNRRGRLTDWFWLIDLPFLTLFWVEFLVRWYLALKRKTYAKWFFFPMFNWYDVLGLIPVMAFRPFRLLRAVSMYMRLRRSELSDVGDDIISRTIAYFSNVITEEVSDRVAIRILGELHEEILDGTHTRIARATVEPRRAEIERVLVNQIRQAIANEKTLAQLRTLLQLNIDNAADSSEALHWVPLPKFVLKPLVNFTGEVIVDTTLETIATTLESEEGQEAVEQLASAAFDDLFYGPGLVEIESLVKEISLNVIDHMKNVVAIKKWTLGDDAPTGYQPDEEIALLPEEAEERSDAEEKAESDA